MSPDQIAEYVCYGCGQPHPQVDTWRTMDGTAMMLCWPCFAYRQRTGKRAFSSAVLAWDADMLTRQIVGPGGEL